MQEIVAINNTMLSQDVLYVPKLYSIFRFAQNMYNYLYFNSTWLKNFSAHNEL